jgi:hypothetical protein
MEVRGNRSIELSLKKTATNSGEHDWWHYVLLHKTCLAIDLFNTRSFSTHMHMREHCTKYTVTREYEGCYL